MEFAAVSELRMADSMPMSESAIYFEEEWAADDMAMNVESETGQAAPAAPGQAATARRMIVTTFNLTAETKEFDVSRNFIRAITDEFGGYIETSSEDGHSIRFNDMHARNAFFTLRIPSGRVHEFVELVGENTNIVNTNEHATDITDSYFDNQARLAALVNQESLLTALLESEGAGLHYILEVHRELANVRHQIEFFNSTIQRQEQSVNYSTVHIGLQEVMQYRPVDGMPTSFGERVSQATSNSWTNFVRQLQNTMVNAIWQLPFFLLGLLRIAFWVAVFLIVRKIIRKKKGRLPGEDTFDWLPISRMKRHKAQIETQTREQ